MNEIYATNDLVSKIGMLAADAHSPQLVDLCVKLAAALQAERASRPEEATRIALRNLMKESAGIMALCEEEIRQAAGHTNFAVFRQRIEEAGSLLEPQNGSVK